MLIKRNKYALREKTFEPQVSSCTKCTNFFKITVVHGRKTSSALPNQMIYLKSVLHIALVVSLALSKIEAARAIRSASRSPYLYAGDAFPVVEYIVGPPASRKESILKDVDEPSFLTERDHGYRIVNFYSSRFDRVSAQIRDSYIQLAYAIEEIAKNQQSNNTIDAYAICCETVPEICKRHGINENMPSFLVYTPGSAKGKLVETVNASSVFKAMGFPLSSGSVIKSAFQNVQIDANALSADGYRHMRTMDELKADVYLSFHTFLRNYTFLDRDEHGKDIPLSMVKRTALKNYLLLIQKTVPPSWNIHLLVKQLINSFMYICKNKAYLLATLDAYQPSVNEYSAVCQAGSTHVSSITCGAWELIHAISVGVVERNTLILHDARAHGETNRKYITSEAISLEETASTISAFVHHFGLGDDEIEGPLFVQYLERCRDEKCLQTNTISAMVSEWIKLPLFLSKTHSEISIQKQHDLSKKKGIAIPSLQQHISAMWPPKLYCPKCWDDYGKWNNDVVYKFMQLEYTDLNEWSLSTPEIRQELLGTNALLLAESRRAVHNGNLNRNHDRSPVFHNQILLIMQRLVLVFSGIGVFMYRVVSNQNKKNQQAMLVLPQTLRTQISRHRSLNKSTIASFIMDQKQS